MSALRLYSALNVVYGLRNEDNSCDSLIYGADDFLITTLDLQTSSNALIVSIGVYSFIVRGHTIYSRDRLESHYDSISAHICTQRFIYNYIYMVL